MLSVCTINSPMCGHNSGYRHCTSQGTGTIGNSYCSEILLIWVPSDLTGTIESSSATQPALLGAPH